MYKKNQVKNKRNQSAARNNISKVQNNLKLKRPSSQRKKFKPIIMNMKNINNNNINLNMNNELDRHFGRSNMNNNVNRNIERINMNSNVKRNIKRNMNKNNNIFNMNINNNNMKKSSKNDNVKILKRMNYEYPSNKIIDYPKNNNINNINNHNFDENSDLRTNINNYINQNNYNNNCNSNLNNKNNYNYNYNYNIDDDLSNNDNRNDNRKDRIINKSPFNFDNNNNNYNNNFNNRNIDFYSNTNNNIAFDEDNIIIDTKNLNNFNRNINDSTLNNIQSNLKSISGRLCVKNMSTRNTNSKLITKNIENEIIVLSHLQFLDNNNMNNFNYNLLDSTKNLQKESIKKYIKIENEKVEELVNKFKTYKMNLVFSDKINIDDSRIYAFHKQFAFWDTANNEVKIYENNYINKLLHFEFDYSEGIHFKYPEDYSIKTINNSINNSKKTSKKTSKINYDEEDEDKMHIVFMVNRKYEEIEHHSKNFISVIELENYDLILLFEEKTVIEIIRNSDEPFPTYCNYKLYIYRLKNEDNKYYFYQEIKINEKKTIKKLSGNRFLSISYKEVEIYSLNNNNQYSCIKIFPISNVFQCYEINENQFIFLTNNTKINYNKKNRIENKEKFSFKIFYCNKLLYEYDIKSNENFSDFIVLKNKYGIFMIENNLLIIDILKNNLIKKYTILYLNNDNKLTELKNNKIIKWNNINDNEFVLINNGNITLFKLNDKSGINLKIIAYSYFKDISNNIIKFDEKNNRFCEIKENKDENNYETIYNAYFY